ncbi:helix-turn-helix domain-containing protein [Vibrio paucivorans]
MKVVINQFSTESVAILHSDGGYTAFSIKYSLIAKPFEARPYREKDVFKTVRNAIGIDETPSKWDVVLPQSPLNSSLRIWRKESVERLMGSATANANVREYFSGLPLRLDYRLNLIKIATFVALQLNWRLDCAFYSEKEIAALTSTSQENVSRCLSEMKARGLLEVVTCRSQYQGGKVLGSYVKVTNEFKSLFLNGIEWLDSEPLYPYTESDYLKHLHEIERVGRELQSLIQRQYYPERVINHAYFLLTY